MRFTRLTFWAVLCAAVMGVPAVQAQQQGPEQPQQPQQQEDQAAKPIPAYRSPLASAAGNDDEDTTYPDPNRLTPDDRSLAGAQALTLGELSGNHTYWQPHVDLNVTGDSNGLNQTTNTGWTSWSSVFGGVDLHRITGNSSMALLYSGGVSISNDGSSSNEVVQTLQFMEKLSFRRAILTILEQLSYLPESAFGYSPPGVGSVSGSGSIGLQAGLQPDQSILTAQGQRLSNALAPQLDVILTPRSSLTFVGTYSSLYYFDNNLLNSYGAGVQAGYNYKMTRKDTLALLYHFTAFRYTNFNQSINDHVVQVSYARRVTGKMAFQIGAGPEFTSSTIPITGAAGIITALPASSSTQLNWSLNTSLTYQLRRTGFRVSYIHGVGGGSGVQAGSVADTINGNMTRQLSRTFTATWQAGYARSNGVTIGTTTSATAAQNQTFDYWTSNVSLSHSIGRTVNMSLSYLLQYQTSNSAFFAGPTGETSLTRNQIFLTFGWRDHPIAF